MSEIKQVKIIDKSDKCYGMVGDVFDVDQSRLSGHDRYYIQIKGYDNCIKAGYTPEDIKRGKLDEVGFHRIVDADKCEMVDTEQTANMNIKKEIAAKDKIISARLPFAVSMRKVAFTGQCMAHYEYSGVAEVPSFVPPYREAAYIKEQIQSGNYVGNVVWRETIPDFTSTNNCLIHYVGSPVYKNSVDIKKLYNKEITIVTHDEQEYEELKEILKQERGQNIDQCDTLNTDAKVYFHYWGNSIMDVDNELSDVSQEKLLDYSECDFVKNRDKWIQDYKKEIEEYENAHPIDELSNNDDLSVMSKQELMELVQSLRKELTDAQETIEYLNDTIDNIHEQEMDELCEE